MGVIDLLRTLFPHNENPEKALTDLDAQLVDLRGRLVEAGHELEARETAAKAATLETLRAGGRASVSEDVKETRDHIAGLKEAIANIEVRRAEVAIEAATARKAAAAEGVVRAVKETSTTYATAWAAVAIGAAVLRRMGARGPDIGGAPPAVQQLVNDGIIYPSAGQAALAHLEAMGGSTADIPPEIWSVFPFGAEPLPLASVEKALAKVLPSVASVGATARENEIARRNAEVAAVEARAQRMEELRAKLREAGKQMAKEPDTDYIANDEKFLNLACLSGALADRSESIPALTGMFSRVCLAREGRRGSGAVTWSRDLTRAARVAGWTGALP